MHDNMSGQHTTWRMGASACMHAVTLAVAEKALARRISDHAFNTRLIHHKNESGEAIFPLEPDNLSS